MLSGHDIQRLDLPPTRITPTSATSIDCICTNITLEDLNVNSAQSTVIENHLHRPLSNKEICVNGIYFT
ncbi:hypothetical protein J6590_062028 [Homalodisca vitripennis]|nr:hypothetical protein J6590_062028 [Homalodisca vitripennis]